MNGAPAAAADGAAAPGAPALFSARTVIALVAAGVIGLALFLILTAYAGDLRGGGSDPRADALSKSAIGFHGLVRMIELSGGRTRLVRDEAVLGTEDLLVVFVEPRTDPERLAALLERRQKRPTLVILPKWQVIRDAAGGGRVRSVGSLPPEALERLLVQIGGIAVGIPSGSGRIEGRELLEGLAMDSPQSPQVARGGLLLPLLAAGPEGAILSQMGEAPHYLLADPDLMNNHGLADAERARAAIEILGALNGPAAEGVAFDLTLNGLGSNRNPLRLAFEPPFLPLTLALFLAALLAGLHGAFRFGAPAQGGRAIAFGKSQLVENGAGLFKLARREHATGGGYAELMRETAAFDSGAHLALRDAELDAYLDRVSPEGGPRFSELAARARAAADASQLLAAARALFQWKKDLIK